MTHPTRENRYLNTIEMRRRETVMRSRPFSVQLEVTTKCNLACIMCARDKYHGRGKNLPDDVLDRFIDDVLPHSQDIIVSSFGEPMLYPRLQYLFDQIDPDSGLELGFFTNFLLMDEDLARQIIESGVAYINASIDGASKETYEAIRKGGKWEELLEKLELFQRVKKEMNTDHPIVNLCVVGSTLNVDETAAFVDLANEYGFDSVKYNPNMYVDDEDMDYLSLVHEQEKTVYKFREAYQRALELDLHTNYHRKPFKVEVEPRPIKKSDDVSSAQLWLNKFKRLWRNEFAWRIENTWKQSGGSGGAFISLAGIKARDKVVDLIPVVNSKRKETPFPHVVPNDAPPRSCGNPWTHVHIKSDGLVYPCCFSDQVMGDLRKQSFEEIWNGEKYQDIRKSLTSGEYWASCRRASCNWVEGSHSSIYGAEIKLLEKPKEIDGTEGIELPIAIKNTSQFGWNPSDRSKEETTSAFKSLIESADQKMIARNTRDAKVSLSYRVMTLNNELIDEGDHVPVPEDTHKSKEIKMNLKIRPLQYGGRVKIKVDLVHEGVTWFSERSNSSLEFVAEVNNVPFSAYLSVWNKNELKNALNKDLKPGSIVEIPIRVKNVGTEPIGGSESEDFLATHWREFEGDVINWEGARLQLTEVIDPKETKDVTLKVEIPGNLKTGRYSLEVDVVRNSLYWLSERWQRPLLAWPVVIAESEEAKKSIPAKDKNGKPIMFEPFGQCVTNTGNKGIW